MTTIKDLQETIDKDPMEFLGKEPLDDNLCGKPHNNGDPDCLECGVIKLNI